MEHTVKTNPRNLSLECFKLLAACFVVFLHIPFPGEIGQLTVCLSRFAVPLFFAVSGWYSFGASGEKLKKRFARILLLELFGDILYVSWRCVRDFLAGETLLMCLGYQLPDLQALKMWLLWSVDPFAGHLWYLSATCLCYLVLWMYTRLDRKNYRPLYAAGLVLLLGCFAMGEFSKFTGFRADYRICRSGLFTGLPVFLLGLFLRENRERAAAFGLPAALAGVVLSVLEWKTLGSHDLYIGAVLTAAGILLATSRFPAVPGWLTKAAAGFGSVSTAVYLVHLLLQEIYGHYFQYEAEIRFGAAEPWFRPLMILGASLTVGFCGNAFRKGIRKIK